MMHWIMHLGDALDDALDDALGDALRQAASKLLRATHYHCCMLFGQRHYNSTTLY